MAVVNSIYRNIGNFTTRYSVTPQQNRCEDIKSRKKECPFIVTVHKYIVLLTMLYYL
jgi:hypothetical protein